MGSLVEYHCDACAFSTGKLSVGWGKAGRRQFWGGLARCEPCKEVGVVDLSSAAPDYGGRRCGHCGGALTLLDGTSTRIPCPRCNVLMDHERLGIWS
jgi:hypothetical protein